MSDTLVRPRTGTLAESLFKHADRVRPDGDPATRVPAPVGGAQPELSSTANDDEQPVAVGGQRTRRYSGQKRVANNTGLATLYVHDSESGVVYELEYDNLGPRFWTPKHDVLILEFRERHVGIEGERLPALLDEIASRRLGELSAAARPEMDPKVEGTAHLRRIVVRLPGFIRLRSNKLDVAREWDDGEGESAKGATSAVEANA